MAMLLRRYRHQCGEHRARQARAADDLHYRIRTHGRISKDELNSGKRIRQPADVRHHSVPRWDLTSLERGLGKREAFTATCTTEEAPTLSRIIQGRNHRRATQSNRIRNAVQVIAPAGLPHNTVVGVERQTGASNSGRKWRAGREVYTDEANAAGQIGWKRLVAKVAARKVNVDALGCCHLQDAIRSVELGRVA